MRLEFSIFKISTYCLLVPKYKKIRKSKKSRDKIKDFKK